jgi:hypothetical protein
MAPWRSNTIAQQRNGATAQQHNGATGFQANDGMTGLAISGATRDIQRKLEGT